jgi:hypothetical protein
MEVAWATTGPLPCISWAEAGSAKAAASRATLHTAQTDFFTMMISILLEFLNLFFVANPVLGQGLAAPAPKS